MSLPSGTITFLFTDVEGSTRLWDQQPEAMRRALVRHDALAADLIERHDGLLVKGRGEGDSLFTVFDEAPDAVRAACALQIACAAEAWPPEAPLRVRMALHTGEADLRERDYYGAAVNRCARLRALARGGQVLLSRFTRTLVGDDLPHGAGVVDLGQKSLRDLTEPEHVYQLVHPDFPAGVPEEADLSGAARPLADSVRKELVDVGKILKRAHENARAAFERAALLQTLHEANQAGLEEARRVFESERAAPAAPASADYDEVLAAVLAAHPARQTVSRLDLLRALAGAGGVSVWEAKRIVDDFCRRRAPDMAGYDGGLLKSVTNWMRGPKSSQDR